MRKICVITGSRADYGLLNPVMRLIDADLDIKLQVIVTGSHLEEELGFSYQEIKDDGFQISACIPMLGQSDDPLGILHAMSIELKSLGCELNRLNPDMVVILGDRYEMMVAAQVAMVLQIPLAHISGGDVGGGTYDNIIRHCITKMASVHFVTHQQAFKRIAQLGEPNELIFNYGSTCVENINESNLLNRLDLEKILDISFKKNIILATFHPLTMSNTLFDSQLKNLLKALDFFLSQGEYSLVFTKANSDSGGKKINQLLLDFANSRQDVSLLDSLGRIKYLSLLKISKVVVGNSSSGIYEAPYLKTPTVDVGERQEGRAAPNSVFRTDGKNISEIIEAINNALSFNFSGVRMIYGQGGSSALIVKKLKELIDKQGLCNKKFIDREFLNDLN